MNEQQMKDQIAQSIQNLAAGNAAEKIEALFQTLGYSTTRKFELDSHNPNDFLDMFGWEGINQQRAIFSEWKSVDFLFQLTEDEIKSNGQLSLFSNQIDQNYLQSYIFLAVGLRGNHYTRTQLSNITREVNRLSDIPIMVLFRHDDGFTLSIINRRPHKRETSKDVLEKITLIKDINIIEPHRAHIEILFDLCLPQLYKQHQFTNFDQLHDAWQKTLDTSELNTRFFKEVANWYFWAVQNVTLPQSSTGFQPVNNQEYHRQDACATPQSSTGFPPVNNQEYHRQDACATFIIRLITRLIFVWFLKEKGLVCDDLFNPQRIQELIRSTNSEESTYYKAILQNLFFATLNQEMNTPSKPDNRKFRNKAKQAGGRDQNYMIHNVYRYENYFQDSQGFLRLLENIPFLNGGLFECLDKPDQENPKLILRVDGFSDRKDNLLNVPNFLFFNESEEVDLNDVYGTKNKRYRVRGLINIFHSYKFTVTENTPIEEEIALDPELLGKVFENLLAAYNPETNTTARKQTGSFYTPREIVDYMVDEALIAYLEKVTQASSVSSANVEDKQDACATKVTQASSVSSANVEDKQDACATKVTQASSVSSANVEDKQDACATKVTQASSVSSANVEHKQDACATKVTQASSVSSANVEHKQDACATKVTQASSVSSANVEHKQDACATLERYKPSQNRQNTYTNIEELGFFDPNTSVSITARNLPHWQQDGVTYFVTFRLADSVPQEKLRQWQDEREKWLKENKQPFSKAQKAEYYQLFSEKINNWLDAGMGSCYLKEPHIAKIVADALHYFNGDRYILGEWVVMPNHVHLLVTPLGDHRLSAILHSWKSFTSNQVNKVLNRQGKFWQEESFDHIVRNPEQLERIQQYIAENPQKAGIKVTQASSLSSANVEHKQDACATNVTQASSLSSANVEHKQDACATKVTQAFSLSSANVEHKQDACATKVTQASSLSSANVEHKQDACATNVTQASSLSSANVEHKQDACATLDRLRHLLAYNDQPHQFTDTEVEGLIEAIDHLKILDPACGSGAFPMGILHKLVFILTKLDPQNCRWKEKQIAKANEIPDSTIREKVIEDIEQAFEQNELDYGRKLYLIENCIYGVDIQPIAIQISKLRFFISLIVHQNIDNSQENRGVRPLPNLETKFVAANALLGIKGAGDFTLRDPRIEEKEKELAEVRRSYFMARTPKTKAKYRELDDRIRHQISEILKSGGFPGESAEKLAIWKPYEQNTFADFFDAEWMFGISDGFDICIGNPPYVRQEQIKEFKPIFKSQYDCYTGVADLYVYFYEQGLKLLKNQGILCYISSNKYFRSGYGEKLRKFLANQSTILQLIDFGDAPIFTAIAYPSIIIASKEQPKNHQTRVLNWELGQPVDRFASVFENQSFFIAQKELTADGWRLESNLVLQLLEKLRKAGTPLGEYVNGRFYYGIKTGFNEAFVVDRETRDRLIAEHPSSAEVLKPFLRGKDVKRWGVNFAEQYLIKIESSENKQHPWSGKSAKDAEKIFAKTYPAIHARFDELREELSKRSDQGKFFWELRSCKYWQEFEQPKIIYPDIAIRCEFAFDTNSFYPDCTLFLIPAESKYLLGFLNSGMIQFFINQICPAVRGDFKRFKSIYVSQIPIPTTTEPQRNVIETLVNYIIYLTAELKDIPSHGEKMVATAEDKLMLSYFEQIVDALVMELYLPEELHSHDKHFMRHLLSENLPDFDTLKGDKMNALRQIFKRLFNSEHPIRVNIYFLNSLEVVRIIRGLG